MPTSRRNLSLVLLLVLSIAALVGAIALVNGGLGGRNSDLANASPTNGQPSHTAPTGGTAPTAPPSPSQPTDGGPTDGGPGASPTGTLAPGATPDLSKAAATERSRPPAELTGYVWPLRNALITSRFAARDFGGFVIIDDREIHDGLDLATRCGDQIRAAHDGTVIYAGRNFDVFLGYLGDAAEIYDRLDRLGRVNTLPIVIVIDDGNGYRSVYVHLNRADVVPGQVVSAGEVIGAEGATGFATGCHLHYGLIRMDGGWQDVVPRLARFGYPLQVRERVDPLRVLPWGDQYAPQRLQDRANASPTPASSTSP